NFANVDTDAQGAGESRAAQAWRALLNGQGSPENFVRVASYNPEPVVVEYGMFADDTGRALLGRLRDAGAAAWWFDCDRPAALAAWKAETVKANRPFADSLWHKVVGGIDAKMAG